MRVFRPAIVREGDEVCVSASVEVHSAQNKLPDELWFRFPINCHDHVTNHLNGFAVALLPLAMTLGEDLHMEGVLSPHLLNGMKEYQRIQCGWKPTAFKPVSIQQERLQAAQNGPSGSGVGCSFSAGVDSFHTLWRHLPENEPLQRYRISHCLMINGFDADSDIENKGHFSRIQKSVEPVMASLDLELIVCRTNYMSFSDPNILKLSFAAMLTAPALVLGRLFSCFFIPSSYRFDEFYRDGSHLMLDHLISTESMETIHDSSHLNRPEKTAVISNWSATHSTLRVCSNATGYQEDTGLIMNCSWCEKCVRTMKTLDILQRRDKFTTFSKKAGHLDVWKCYFGYKGARIHAREVMSQAWKAGRLDIWLDYCIAIAVSFIIKVPRDLIQRVHLLIEERSEFYAVHVRRLLPRLKRRARWIR
jgi:hypothetical protein